MSWFKKMTPEEAAKFNRSPKNWLIPVIVGFLLTPFIISWLNNTIKAPTNFENSKTSDVYNIEEATIGVPYTYDLSWISRVLEPKSSGPYTYYLGSGVGFQPMGLKLDPFSGVLSGAPKVAGTSNFEVCVKDVGGRSFCKEFNLDVNPAVTNEKKVSVPPPSPSWSCPANSHESSSDSSKCLCDTGYETNSVGNGCVRASAPTPPKNTGAVDNTCESFAVSSCGNIIPGDGTTPDASLAGMPIFDYCSCPKGTYFDGHIDTIPKEYWGNLPAGYHGNHTMKMCICDGH